RGRHRDPGQWRRGRREVPWRSPSEAWAETPGRGLEFAWRGADAGANYSAIPLRCEERDMTTELKGVIPMTATPFDAAGQVDEASIATLVEFKGRCGVHGLNVLGIMGEAHKLSEGERRRVDPCRGRRRRARLRTIA